MVGVKTLEDLDYQKSFFLLHSVVFSGIWLGFIFVRYWIRVVLGFGIAGQRVHERNSRKMKNRKTEKQKYEGSVYRTERTLVRLRVRK